MEKSLVLKKDILSAFAELGIKKGQTIEVHTSLSSFGFVCGGAQIVIEALLESVGEEGTILMPTQSWKNLDPSTGVHWEEPEEWWQIIRDNWPAYNKDITPTNTMGAVAEMFRKWPGALRSDHPARSVAAWGKPQNILLLIMIYQISLVKALQLENFMNLIVMCYFWELVTTKIHQFTLLM